MPLIYSRIKTNESLEIWNSKTSPDGKASMIYQLLSGNKHYFFKEKKKTQKSKTNKQKNK